MIIDAHQHLVTGSQIGQYQAFLINGRGFHGKGHPGVTAETVASWKTAGKTHSQLLDDVGTDMAFLSPRPYSLMHSEKPDKIVHWFCEANNTAISLAVQNEPDRFRGVAGLPQCDGAPVTDTFEEIDRCINELGFIGIMINPDPSEGLDNDTPPMGDEYWYPLYERMVKYDVPAFVHSASCKNVRESYTGHFITEESIQTVSICDSTVYDDFPTLKIIMCHGGGSIPYQIGRWRALRWRQPNVKPFDESLRQLYFDSVLYNKEGLELLFKIVGTDRCMFGTERPGTGSSKDPNTGLWLDDLKPVIEDIDWLTDEDRANVFENVARECFPRFGAA